MRRHLRVRNRLFQLIVENSGRVKDVHILKHQRVGLRSRLLHLGLWVNNPDKVGQVDHPAKQVTETIQIARHSPVILHCRGRHDLGHDCLAFLQRNSGKFPEPVRTGQVLVLHQSSQLGTDRAALREFLPERLRIEEPS